jgi:MFS transporter, MHS family, proline/betaine transporter
MPRPAGADAHPISLIEEFLLLTLEDEGGEFDTVPEAYTRCGVAGAALTDLALRGRIDSDLEAVWVVDPTPTGDAPLDRVLAEMAAEPRRLAARDWIERLARHGLELRRAALASLCAAGILREHDHQFLWVMESRRYPRVAGQARPEAKRRILALLFSDDIPAPADAALTGIAHACGVFSRILTAREYARALPRIEQIARLDLIGAQIATTAHAVSTQLSRVERLRAMGGFASNALDYYEFSTYGLFAATIGRQFFPSENPDLPLLAAFGLLALGFMARPLGATLFNRLNGRLAPRRLMLITLLLMALPTSLIALLPTYAQIGIAAPALLLALRFLQGIAAGGEYSAAMVLLVILVEGAQRSRRGWLGGFATLGAFGGMLLGALIGFGLLLVLPESAVQEWGWRIAFLFGMLLSIAAYLLRRAMPKAEDDLVRDMEKGRIMPFVLALVHHWQTILRIIAVQAGPLVCTTLCFVHITQWLQETRQIPTHLALAINGAGLVALLLLIPYFGAVSDRIGRKPVLMTGLLAMSIFSVPLFWHMEHASLLMVLLAELGLALLLATSRAATSTYICEAAPRRVRCSALNIAHIASAALFSGGTPLLAVILIKKFGTPLAPAWYLSFVAFISFLVVALVRSPALAED